MLFNSFEFIFLFVPIVFSLYFLLNKFKLYSLANVVILFASLYFYSFFNFEYVFIILASIIVNYTVGVLLQTQKNKMLLWVGILFNIGLLGYYKYTDFFIQNINRLPFFDYPLQNIILPLAISFFTFQQISFIMR